MVLFMQITLMEIVTVLYIYDMEKVKVSPADLQEEEYYKFSVSRGLFHGSFEEYEETRKEYRTNPIHMEHPDPPGELGEEGTIGNNSGTISGWILENRKLGKPL